MRLVLNWNRLLDYPAGPIKATGRFDVLQPENVVYDARRVRTARKAIPCSLLVALASEPGLFGSIFHYTSAGARIDIGWVG